jgi:RNA polymerase sigma-70 factor (ECF subfamily)
MVVALLPNEPEAAGLLSLILLHESRRHTRTDDDGNLVPLEFQTRAMWDESKTHEGTGLLKTALAMGRIGPFQLQAAISACHAEAISWPDTDWPQIASLYELLLAIQPSAVIALNHVYALSHTRGTAQALERLSLLQSELGNYQPFHAAKADILQRSGRTVEARASYGRAIELSQNNAEKLFLERKLSALTNH